MTEASPDLLSLVVISVGLGLLTLVLVTSTSFVKIAVVLFILRNALGVQQTPPNVVLYAIAIILTMFITAPVLEEVAEIVTRASFDLATPAGWGALLAEAQEPVRLFLDRHTPLAERDGVLSAARELWTAEQAARIDEDSLAVMVPAFLIAELRRAFEIGFLIYLPFVIIDLIVTTVLMAMGMSMVTPALIATPAKLLVFVSIDGWGQLISGLLISYAGGGG
ncbi:MAG: type III secretion system export apparatus subunit SctR [Roseinatronobacter sp.]